MSNNLEEAIRKKKYQPCSLSLSTLLADLGGFLAFNFQPVTIRIIFSLLVLSIFTIMNGFTFKKDIAIKLKKFSHSVHKHFPILIVLFIAIQKHTYLSIFMYMNTWQYTENDLWDLIRLWFRKTVIKRDFHSSCSNSLLTNVYINYSHSYHRKNPHSNTKR